MAYLTQMHDPIAAWLGAWSAELGLGSVALRAGLAILFASLVGLERAQKRHTAGLRTFMLVSLFSCTAMLLDLFLALPVPILSAACILDVGSISTYSILFSSKSQIKGLTTAVALWACCILGLAIGGGFYTLAAIVFAALLLCLDLMPTWEDYLKERSNHFEVHLELRDKRELPNFTATARELGLRIDDIEANPAYLSTGLSVYTVSLTIVSPELKAFKKHREITAALASLESVSYIELI